MKANSSPMSVADYCQDLNANKIVVNTDYQRSEGIWSSSSRSFFIESILLEYPIPKLYLYAKLDLKTRHTIKEIVDGQQRSQSLRDFFNGKLRLSTKIDTEELQGKKYNQLTEEWQTRFLSYSLPIDQFSGISEDEVQEAFRRMNSSNVPLNDEEQRNARFQGQFKWFIIHVAKEYRNFLASINLFSKRDIIRMTDLKVYAEIAHALDQGFQTVKGANLDALYKKYNSSFEKEDDFKTKISYGIDNFIQNVDLHQSTFLRGHVFQSLILAIIAKKYQDDEQIKQATDKIAITLPNLKFGVWDIEILHQSLSEPENFPDLQEFIEACSKKTNVGLSKFTRFAYFYYAL